MNYKEIFYKGFDAANKNLLLVLVKLAAAFVMVAGVVIAIIGLILVFGAGALASLKHYNFDNLSQLLTSNYLILAIVVVLIILVFILFASIAALYIYGGTCGMIARGIKERGFKFTMSGFFAEGNRYFGALLWFTSVVGAAAMVILLVLAASVFPLKYIINTMGDMNRMLSTFMTILSVLVGIVIFLFLVAGILAVTFYGTAAMVFKGTTAMQATGEALRFILKRPWAFWFFMICTGASIIANLMIATGLIGVSVIPGIGAVLAIPYQMLVQIVQVYIGLLFIAVLFSYYFEAEGLGSATIFDNSNHAADTSFAAPELEMLPPPTAAP
ncbi:MAG: hypothetical protein HQK97_00800 [Nitrospirae bacterium]|nr:hypothetical protein [Nitrospirota bacterium]